MAAPFTGDRHRFPDSGLRRPGYIYKHGHTLSPRLLNPFLATGAWPTLKDLRLNKCCADPPIACHGRRQHCNGYCEQLRRRHGGSTVVGLAAESCRGILALYPWPPRARRAGYPSCHPQCALLDHHFYHYYLADMALYALFHESYLHYELYDAVRASVSVLKMRLTSTEC